MKSFLLILFVFLVSSNILIGGESIQPYHWSIQYIQYFKMRGYLHDISINDQPFNNLSIAKTLFLSEEKKLFLTRKEADLLKQLQSAYSYPSMAFRSDSNFAVLMYGFYSRGFWNSHPDYGAPKKDAFFNSKLYYNISNRYFLFGNLALKNKKINEEYSRKTFRGFYAFTEQGYFMYKSNNLDFKIGRDYLKIGPGIDGNLLFSENAGAFDQYHATLKYRGINFSFFGILLDGQSKLIKHKLAGINGDTLVYRSWRDVNRYLNGHRLSINYKDKLFIGLNEVAVYGGYDKNWNWELLNPFIPYMDLNINDQSVDTNTLFSIDFSWYLKNRALLYGELLIDDYQIEKKVVQDLEPNELGFIAGIRYINLFNLNPSILGVEYTQVRNRTYNAPEFDWEKYLFNNEYIAHKLGNNFEKIDMTFDYFFHPNSSVNFYFSYVKKGEEGIRSDFNKDYLKYDVKEGYKEQFPFGIVHSYFSFNIMFEIHLKNNSRASIYSSYSSHKNYDNIKGLDKNFYSFGFKYWLDFSVMTIF